MFQLNSVTHSHLASDDSVSLCRYHHAHLGDYKFATHTYTSQHFFANYDNYQTLKQSADLQSDNLSAIIYVTFHCILCICVYVAANGIINDQYFFNKESTKITTAYSHKTSTM